MPWRAFQNLSTPDRLLRILLGIALLALGWSGAVGGVTAIALRVFGVVPLVTGILGWCPFYALFGISTRRAGPVRGS
jgi:hypothetical protein